MSPASCSSSWRASTFVHVPYRGSTPALTDLLAGQVQVMFDVTPSSLPHIKAGKLRPLAVTTAKRLDVLPDVPVMADFLPGYEASAWIGFGAPKNTPAAVIDTLNNQFNAAIADPTIKKRLAELGALAMPPNTPAEFAKHHRRRRRQVGEGDQGIGHQARVKRPRSMNLSRLFSLGAVSIISRGR